MKKYIRVAREHGNGGWRGASVEKAQQELWMNESLKASTKGGRWSKSLSWKMRCRMERREKEGKKIMNNGNKKGITTVTLTTRLSQCWGCCNVTDVCCYEWGCVTEESHQIGFCLCLVARKNGEES